MILIFCETINISSKQVLEYLRIENQKFETFTENDVIEFTYEINDSCFSYKVYKNDKFICLDSQIKSIWYSRVDIRVKNIEIQNVLNKNELAYKELESYSVEYNYVRYSKIIECLHSKKCLGTFGKGNFNKISFLEKCNELRIGIPDTLITSSKLELISFLKKHNNSGIITKSLGVPYLELISKDLDVEKWKRGVTVEVNSNDLIQIPDTFQLSLFQNKIEKEFEIRTFYLNGDCYSMAIFSQSTELSMLDCRLGDDIKMRRCSYTLPKMVEKKVCELMKSLNLNTGSLDIILTKKGDFVFLEVNPVGQFGDVSYLTNANIEYRIAKYLID